MPPLVVVLIEPLASAKHFGCSTAGVMAIAAGAVRVLLCEIVQPAASAMVTE